MNTTLIIPTYNAGEEWEIVIESILMQCHRPNQIIIIDSSSSDNTALLAEQANFTVKQIKQIDFSHSKTRNMGLAMCNKETEFVIFMTQDTILADEYAFDNLLASFADEQVVTCYGRQLPKKNATPIAAHARLFNYPEHSAKKTKAEIPRLGIKTVFMSNSFSAYRLSTLKELGNFSEEISFAEDMDIAARMVLSDYAIYYAASAKAYHSHNYSVIEEFKRYRDIAKFHNQSADLLKAFGQSEKEGKKYVLSELRYLFQQAKIQIPNALLRTVIKYLAYKLPFTK